MSKFTSLLKKVELFEKLAVYGDRKVFLQSLSQMQTTPALSGGAAIPTPGTPGTPGGRPLNFGEKLHGGPDPQRYIELEPGEGDPAPAPGIGAQDKTPIPSGSKPLPAPGSPGTPGGRPLTLAEKLKGPPYPAK